MATDATIQMTTTTRREASSTAWFWWKETRQLAPLVVLLVIVALVIIALNLITDMAFRSFNFQMPNEMTMLVFPGLFATGAGPLLIGQERALGALNWLSLLPISARRLAGTKFCVALVGLIVMWVFAFTVVTVFDLGSPTASHWRIGRDMSYSGNPFSYPVWIAHSLFILLSGFYVAWRIKNQFYSLVALIPLAFSPIIVTSLLSELPNGPKLTSELDWTNLVFTIIGIVVVAPLSYRAAMRTLSPAKAPAVTPLLGGLGHSPAKDLSDAIAPRFGTQVAPIVWQSVHSARGMLAILIGMLLVSLLVSMRLAAVDRYQGLDGMIGVLLLAAPLAVCWLGVSVFQA